ncbi:hypothetical protein F5Y03DRAFT_377404 [Xylaria venustula]|nr:hypothetical protein F5Y03DRAFT_377404 [Xylaria venustula]
MSSTVSASDSDAGPVDNRPPNNSNNTNIDITAQPAIITWRDSNGNDQYLSHLTLDLHYDVRSSKAFCKLRAAVALKSHPRSRNTAVFLFIHPERIHSLVLDDAPCAAQAMMLGPDTVGLNFEMSRLPALVVPKESLVPRNQASGSILDSLQAAVQQPTFTLYAKISCRLLPRQRLRTLCDALSRNEITSIVAHSNAASLYAGAGGKSIDGGSLVRPDGTAIVSGERDDSAAIEPLAVKENPPSYDEVPPGPPPAVMPNPNKRQRLSTPEAETALYERLGRKYIEEVCARMIDNRLGELRRDMTKQLQDLENRVIDYVDEQLILQRQEAADHFGVQTEDAYYGLKIDLQNYVQEEVEEAEGRILGHLGTASFSLQLNP